MDWKSLRIREKGAGGHVAARLYFRLVIDAYFSSLTE
jgi:hypothetical protein